MSAAINKHFYTVLEKRNDGKIQIISADLRTVETWQDIARMEVRGNALEIPLAVIKEFGCNVSVNLFLASEIPPGTGLGSSASVCVNLTKVLATYNRVFLSKYELADRAFHVARNVLGRPVGKQDEYASAFGGLNFISFYRDGLGHRLLWRSDEAAGFALPETDAELVVHLYIGPETDILVGDVDEAFAAFLNAGGQPVQHPFDIAIGRCARVRDPFGNELVMLDQSKADWPPTPMGG